MTTNTSTRATALLDTLGVNIHLEYTDSKYVNVTKVISSLQYLGVNYVRDGAVYSKYQGQASYDKVAAAGFKFDMFAQASRDPASVASAIATFAAAHPGSIVAIEGPNEIDHAAVSYAGLIGVAAGLAYQTTLNNAVKGEARLSGVVTYNLTGANITSSSDYANLHPYPRAGVQPLTTLTNAVHSQATVMAGKGVVLSEFGYYTAPQSSDWGGVDQASQAKLLLNGVLDADLLGVSRTYIYQLLDAYADPIGLNVDKNMGLFDLAGNPKLAATAIHNLTTLLADHGATATTFTTDPLSYSLQNLPTTGHSMLVEKSTGEHDILVWAEPTIWNNTAHKAVTAATSQVAVNFGSEHHAVAVFDPLVSSTTPISTYNDVTSLKVAVTDHPVIVEVFDVGHTWVSSNHV